MNPTDEQIIALDFFATGENLVVEAGAGTGKTSTLILMSEETDRKGQFIAFNKAIVTDAEKKFPSTVKCNTAHSLAYRSVGAKFKHRLNGPRMKSNDLASIIGVKAFNVGPKRLAAGFLAGVAMKAITNFCNSADLELKTSHFSYIDGIDEPFADGRKSYENNGIIRSYLLPHAKLAWKDICNLNGRLPFKHEHYLKIWALSKPKINADYILFDECQDANAVLLSIVESQTDTQKIFVGDGQQAIYEWTGAVNAIEKISDTGANKAYLTRSWRFGSAIADKANEVLDRLHAPLRLVGHPDIESYVDSIESPEVYLSRTNAGAVRRLFKEIENEGKPFIVGGGTEITAFAYGALDLMKGRTTSNPDLACFDDWAEVCEYTANDHQGDELKLMVSIMNEFGPVSIIDALKNQSHEKDASLVISTAHKSKGREWNTVTLADDFPVEKKLDIPEMRLLYVAATRAKFVLDPFAVSIFSQ